MIILVSVQAFPELISLWHTWVHDLITSSLNKNIAQTSNCIQLSQENPANHLRPFCPHQNKDARPLLFWQVFCFKYEQDNVMAQGKQTQEDLPLSKSQK